MNNEKLIKQCKQGNQQAEKEVFFRFAGKVLSICRRYTASDSEAKDYMQECFLRIFEKISTYEARKGVFEAWLYQVCTNTILGLLRKNRRKVKIVYLDVLPEDMEEVEVEWNPSVSAEDLLTFIQQLPKGYRSVLNLFAFEGLSHKEIAKHLNISESTSRSQYARAKGLLKQNIQKKTGLRYEKRG